DAAIMKVLESGHYILGEEVAYFEREFADYLGADFAVGCGSGTDALVLALKALDIGPGDEVIVPSHTAVPTVAAVVMVGATPVYVDIEPEYYTIDPDQVEAACTDKTKAVIAVHLYGQAAAMDDLMAIAKRHDLRLIEDCAQATGATYHGKKLGTIGDVGCFSFFPTKNLGAIGDGGAIVCNTAQIADLLRRLRQYGWSDNRISKEPGINSRLDELQAAILRVKLRHLDMDNGKRQQLAAHYTTLLAEQSLRLPAIRAHAEHVFHLYVVRSSCRRDVIEHLKTEGIHAAIHYAMPVHFQPAYTINSRIAGSMEVTERVVKEVLSLPIYPELSSTVAEDVVVTIQEMQ
ncbi:MAG: DegT/DnrJ/EryC1/StrS family aminotransferase, partial [Mariprofundales bacterium]|nr:DegT/DnrJ/EryC1/StrS family aminotransferase [Mariprofundales bacterium]